MIVLRLNKKDFEKTMKAAAAAIKRGKVIVCPTDTVYGLLADATNKKAVDRVFKIKKRDNKKPIPIFVKDLNAAKKLAEIDGNKEKFLKKFWPGKVTAVLKFKVKSSKLKVYGADKKTVALRIPNHKVISYLLSIAGLPLTGTSANISGKPASGNIKEVIKQFTLSRVEGQPDLIIDTGNLKKSKPSKIIDLTVKPPKILRH
jgi:L-threonylcarbamoyladenylate synthase